MIDGQTIEVVMKLASCWSEIVVGSLSYGALSHHVKNCCCILSQSDCFSKVRMSTPTYYDDGDRQRKNSLPMR